MVYKESNLIPYFQPIMSIDNSSILGFEVVPKYIGDNKLQNLTEFLDNEQVDIEERREVDRIIRKKAIKKFKEQSQPDTKLFLEIKLEWINTFSKNPQDMPTLVWFKENDLSFDRLIIEINEADLKNCDYNSIMGLSYYTSIGVKIAIEDYGKNGIDVNMISNIRPDIIKINGEFVKNSEINDVYREFLSSQTSFANKLGIEVVYKGIESKRQLDNCVKCSGRYYEGAFIGGAQENIADIISNDNLKNCFIKYVMSRQNKQIKKDKLRLKLDKVVDELTQREVFCKDGFETDDRLMQTADIIPNYVKRIFLCNKYGFQITSNVEYLEGTIGLIDNYNKNWAWREYFKEAVFNINGTTKSYITHSYKNISTNESIYTYVRELDGITYLLADVSIDCI